MRVRSPTVREGKARIQALANARAADTNLMNHKRDIVDDINKSAYAADDVVDWYEDFDFILKPEAAILKKIEPVIRDQQLLDIGIGAGRTTKFLLEISSHYTGIDYTARSAELAQEKFPSAKVLCCDARDL